MLRVRGWGTCDGERAGGRERWGRRRRGSQGTESFGRQIPDNVARTCNCYRASPDNSGNVQPAGAPIKIGSTANGPSAQYSSAPCVLSRDARQLRVREQFAAGDVRSLCAYNHASSVLIHAALHRQLIQAQTTQWAPGTVRLQADEHNKCKFAQICFYCPREKSLASAAIATAVRYKMWTRWNLALQVSDDFSDASVWFF